jgi:hypothetical protein
MPKGKLGPVVSRVTPHSVMKKEAICVSSLHLRSHCVGEFSPIACFSAFDSD